MKLVAVLALSLAGCGKDAGERCTLHGATAHDCRGGLECFIDVRRDGSFCMTAEEADALCQAKRECADSGQCTHRGYGDCVATKANDCARSSDCRQYGKCAASPYGFCATASAEQCRASVGCETVGACTRDPSSGVGICVVGSDEDCRGSKACKEGENCTRVERAGRWATCEKR